MRIARFTSSSAIQAAACSWVRTGAVTKSSICRSRFMDFLRRDFLLGLNRHQERFVPSTKSAARDTGLRLLPRIRSFRKGRRYERIFRRLFRARRRRECTYARRTVCTSRACGATHPKRVPPISARSSRPTKSPTSRADQYAYSVSVSPSCSTMVNVKSCPPVGIGSNAISRLYDLSMSGSSS